MNIADRLDEIEARAQVGAAEVIRICTGGERIRMSIPANMARDTDLILIDVCDSVPALVAALRAVLAVHKPEWEAGGYYCIGCNVPLTEEIGRASCRERV